MGSTPIGSRCVRCGFCCKQSPCPWGIWNDKEHRCSFLEKQQDGTYLCGRYAEIVTQIAKSGRIDDCPAFGGGCSSTLFNRDRDEIITKILERAATPMVG